MLKLKLFAIAWLACGLAFSSVAAKPSLAAPTVARKAAQDLPRFKGKSRIQVEKMMKKQKGWTPTSRSKVSTEYKHPDGSYVRIDAYGNAVATPAQPFTANNAHAHKEDHSQSKKKPVKFDDRGSATKNPDDSHTGMKNPRDFEKVRNRPHGQGTPKPGSGRATGKHPQKKKPKVK